MSAAHPGHAETTVKNRVKVILLAAAALLAAGLAFWLWPRPLTVTPYEIQTELTAPVRIVQLTDLHGREFGEGSTDLIALTAQQQPDLILMTGDMLPEEGDLSSVCRLVQTLSDVAPVYYSLGNRENDRVKAGDTAWRTALEAAGATVLELSYADITVNGQALRIGGYYGYYGAPHMDTRDTALQQEKSAFTEDFENTDRQKLLLCHIPTAWLDWRYIDSYDAGIVFSGHYHGGLIRLPLSDRGLYAPYVGLFPEYTKGLFLGKTSACVLSTGLSGDRGIPRICNPPEICVTELLPR